MSERRNYVGILILAPLLTLFLFIYGFLKEVGIGHPVLYFLLTSSLVFKLIKVLFEWYHYAGISEKPAIKQTPLSQKNLTVDMFTTACPGEPFEMIESTLRAMKGVRYPHKNYLCDEGNDPDLRQLCQDLNINYITRSNRDHAKAGNINNALAQSTGDICVILDPDHAPTADFLDQVLFHFDDPQVGYVQVVQAYQNHTETLIARAAAEQTYLFYGPFMRAMGKYGTAQAIGANCTFRRLALDSIGGHAPGLTEDMHTSMLLHSKGWKSVFVPKIVSRGLVPSSLSAYYKQQLKWSRGTFDLWINLFPFLFRKFSWRQNIHYGLMPVYYLSGFITLINMTVPVISLLTGEYPWLLNPRVFFIYFTPFLVSSLLMRLYAQRWLNEPGERGLHLLGGIVRVGCWWIYILGFVYTLFNIKVPYIPTPKIHNSKNEFLLGLPNLMVAGICVSAAVYGLKQDWQPYSFLMAGFAFSNSIIFLLAFIISQSTWISAIRKFWWDFKLTFSIKKISFSYQKLSLFAIPFIIVFLLTFTSFLMPFSIISAPKETLEGGEKAVVNKEFGGIYTGIYLPSVNIDNGLVDIRKTEKEAGYSWAVVSTYLSWSEGNFPVELWQSIIKHGSVPMITWEPFIHSTNYSSPLNPDNNQGVFLQITEGYFDDYIDQMAVNLRSLDSPVFLRFAHEMDNPMYPWSVKGGNTAEEFKAAWRYLHDRFDAQGVGNVSWIWSPWSTSAMDEYFPYGQQNSVSQYVDWISFTVLNYGLAGSDQKSKSFQEIYKPFRQKMKELSIDLPVMLAEFGSTSYGEDAASWNKKSLFEIKQSYPEIKSVILFYSDSDNNWISDWRPDEKSPFIDWTFNLTEISPSLNKFEKPLTSGPSVISDSSPPTRNKNIKGSYGNFSWLVDGSPFYMKGICYNPGHDWHDGFYPLTRNQLENDFKQIKASGANTIRRYEPGIYDRNILNVAEKYDLKVMYGFWFDPTIDYYKDTAAIKAYEKKVLNQVEKYRDQRSIIAWNIGNETWGLLKKYYAKPYLNLTRMAYLKFLEGLAQKIHEIDTVRPVFTSEEHDHYRLISAVHDFSKYAPSIDVIGINSYYEQNIQNLQGMVSQFDTLRPYAVTEFGPKGYWSHEFGDFRNDSILTELSSLSKGEWYEKQWKEYIEANRGYNLGGLAYSWRDRFEGTATWFGISDFKGRLKPAYYYLQRAWNRETIDQNKFADLSIVGHWYPLDAGETLWFSAGITNNYNGSLSYEWEVYEENTWDRKSPVINSILDKQFVEIRMPEKKSSYRVYLYATDSTGNVVTASRPLLFR